MKFLETLKALPLQRQMALVAAVIAVVIAMSVMVSGVVQENKALLYSGLDPAHSGEIIDALQQRGIAYDIRGDAIFVSQSARDTVRFDLAKDGLPRQSVQGYELLDNVNGFSVTSEMYNAAFWRAKEGELTRTVLAIPGVESARVHIGASLRSGFSRTQPAQTASVTLSTTYGFSASQAEAIQYLVALAVSGMSPEEVAVIDARGAILAGPGAANGEQPGVMAESQAGMVEQKILRLLEARLGANNARVSVMVDIDRERQLTSAVTFDPNSRVIRNRTITDASENSNGSRAGLTVASNLPQGEGQGGTTNTTNTRNSSETVSYEMSETRTEIEKMPGDIERISVGVLVNADSLGIDFTTPDGEQLAADAIEDFEQLIMSGAGLDVSRGDTLTVELMPFQPIEAVDLVAAPSLTEQLMQRYFWSGVQIILLGLVVVVLGLGVVRPLVLPKPEPEAPILEDPQLLSADAAAAPETVPPADPFDYLKDYALERQNDTAALLQEWLNDDRKVSVNE